VATVKAAVMMTKNLNRGSKMFRYPSVSIFFIAIGLCLTISFGIGLVSYISFKIKKAMNPFKYGDLAEYYDEV
jgi:hypothetical protein